MQEFSQWDGFKGRRWKEGVNVRDFIQNNYTPVSYTHLDVYKRQPEYFSIPDPVFRCIFCKFPAVLWHDDVTTVTEF